MLCGCQTWIARLSGCHVCAADGRGTGQHSSLLENSVTAPNQRGVAMLNYLVPLLLIVICAELGILILKK